MNNQDRDLGPSQMLWETLCQVPGAQRFTRRKTSLRSYELCDGSGAVVGTVKRRGILSQLTAIISTNDAAYRLHGISRCRVQDRSDGKIVFTCAKPKTFALFDRLVSPDGNTLRFRYSGAGADKMIMEIVDERDVSVIALRWLAPVDPHSYRFPLGEAVLPPGPKQDIDPTLLVGLAFQFFQWHLLPKGSPG